MSAARVCCAPAPVASCSYAVYQGPRLVIRWQQHSWRRAQGASGMPHAPRPATVCAARRSDTGGATPKEGAAAPPTKGTRRRRTKPAPDGPASEAASQATEAAQPARGFGAARRAGLGTGKKAGKPRTLKQEAQKSNEGVYDRLIEVFASRPPEDWRRLIVYSSQWPVLADGVFKRAEERAAAALAAAEAAAEAAAGAAAEAAAGAADGGVDPAAAEAALALRRLGRRLRVVWDELRAHGDTLQGFREAAASEWESMVVARRHLLGADFFDYLELRVRASHGRPEEASELARLALELGALAAAADDVARDTIALDAASVKLAQLLQSPTLEAADAKIDELAASGSLDPALLLTMARAYAGVKETDITREEVKDVMAHLYFKAKESFAAAQPPEVRILKHLLGLEGAGERREALDQAFEQGPELSTASEDFLSTTPPKLLNAVDNILALYDRAVRGGGIFPASTSSGGGSGAGGGVFAGHGAAGQPGSMASQAAALMNPEVIERLRQLRGVIQAHYT